MVTSLLHYFHNSIYNIGISAASAKITTHQFLHILNVFSLALLKHTYRRTYLSRCTIAALKSIVLYKSCLQWVQLVTTCQAFDSGDFGTVFHYCEGQATVDAFAV